jgi:hypothetical protein
MPDTRNQNEDGLVRIMLVVWTLDAGSGQIRHLLSGCQVGQGGKQVSHLRRNVQQVQSPSRFERPVQYARRRLVLEEAHQQTWRRNLDGAVTSSNLPEGKGWSYTDSYLIWAITQSPHLPRHTYPSQSYTDSYLIWAITESPHLPRHTYPSHRQCTSCVMESIVVWTLT